MQVGDQVKIRYPRKRTNMSRNSEPRQVIKTRGTEVLLDNGQWWNGSNLGTIKSMVPSNESMLTCNARPEDIENATNDLNVGVSGERTNGEKHCCSFCA